MTRFPGILKLLFAILILVTVGELGYYLYFQTKLPKPETEDTAKTTQASIIDIPSLIQFNRLKSNNAVKSSIITDRLEGTIVELDMDGVIHPISGLEYKLKVVLINDQDRVIRYLNEEEITKFKINTADLKVGDKLVIQETVDLLKGANSNLLDLKISKI